MEAGDPVPAAVVRSPTLAQRWEVVALGVAQIVIVLLLVSLAIGLWPVNFDKSAQQAAPAVVPLLWGALNPVLAMEARLLLLVMLLGALGSFIHSATSFIDFVGNDKLARSWLWWYLLRPFIGMALALIVYLAVRGGLLGGSGTNDINLYGVAAMAGLVGMFTKQATDKLSEVFNTLFRTVPGGGDAQRKDDLVNAVPVVTDLNPTSVEAATQNVVVEVIGINFVKGSAVRINGVGRETEFRSTSHLAAKLLAEDVAQESQLLVTVYNPPPGGGVSTPLRMRVSASAGAAAPLAAASLVAPARIAGLEADEPPLGDETADGCDVAVLSATPDEALPAARGGVSQP